jgi:hypothetical protein
VRETEGFAKLDFSLYLMMGDHSKCGINTMFNTGTVVGVSANILVVDLILYQFSWEELGFTTNH